jgi:hypothetical protein
MRVMSLATDLERACWPRDSTPGRGNRGAAAGASLSITRRNSATCATGAKFVHVDARGVEHVSVDALVGGRAPASATFAESLPKADRPGRRLPYGSCGEALAQDPSPASRLRARVWSRSRSPGDQPHHRSFACRRRATPAEDAGPVQTRRRTARIGEPAPRAAACSGERVVGDEGARAATGGR